MEQSLWTLSESSGMCMRSRSDGVLGTEVAAPADATNAYNAFALGGERHSLLTRNDDSASSACDSCVHFRFPANAGFIETSRQGVFR